MINLRALQLGIPFRTRSGCRRSTWSTRAEQCYTGLHRATQCYTGLHSATATGESR